MPEAVMLTRSEAQLILDAIDEYVGSDNEGRMHDDELVLAMITADKVRQAARKER